MSEHRRVSLQRSLPESSPAPTRWTVARVAAVAAIGLLTQSAIADEIGRYLEQARKVYGLPAVVLGVIRDGKLIDVRTVGSANVELNVKARADHAFEIGSISKMFTAYAILLLRERGLLELNAPVGRFLTDLPANWDKATVHQLLSHTSGLPDLEEAFGYGIYRETPSDAELLRRLATLPIGFDPGAKWEYSNTNYWLLALVIEKLTGMSYADFMQLNIFGPLGMTSTRSALPSKLFVGRAAGYRRAGAVLEYRDATQPNAGRGLGDISSTVADMAKWEREQLSPTLMPRTSAALARQSVVLNDGKSAPYGYGWFTTKILPTATIHHSGQTAGFNATYIRVPARRLAVVVFSNSHAAPAESIGKFSLRQVEPALRAPRLTAITDETPHITALVRRYIVAGPSAPTEWREEWFSQDYWRSIKQWLNEMAEYRQGFGEVRSITLVGRTKQDDVTTLTYRVVHANLTRLVVIRFDALDRIIGSESDDE